LSTCEILINVEALEKISAYTQKMKQEISDAYTQLSSANDDFVAVSIGKFTDKLSSSSAKFTEDVKNHLEKLEAIEKYIETTVRLQTQLDSQLAADMKLSD
jgi:hypothetical protein